MNGRLWRGSLCLCLAQLAACTVSVHRSGDAPPGGAKEAGLPPTCFTSSPGRPLIVTLGDTITEMGANDGWVTNLTDTYKPGRKADVVNRGFTGYLSRWLRWQLDAILPSSLRAQTLLTIIMVGSYDARDSSWMPPQLCTSVDEYEANLVKIATLLRLSGVKRTMIVTPPAVDAAKLNLLNFPPRTHMSKYADAARRAARTTKSALVDFYAATTATGTSLSSLLLPDGINLTPAGHNLLFQLVLDGIQSAFPDMHPRSMKTQFPDYVSLGEHPELALPCFAATHQTSAVSQERG